MTFNPFEWQLAKRKPVGSRLDGLLLKGEGIAVGLAVSADAVTQQELGLDGRGAAAVCGADLIVSER